MDPISGKNISFALAKCIEHTSVQQIAGSGWAGTVTLLREYGLGDDGELTVRPFAGYERLHDQLLAQEQDVLAEAVELSEVSGRALHIMLSMSNYIGNGKCGVRFLSNEANQYVEFYYDNERGKFCLNTIFAGNTDTKGCTYLDYGSGGEAKLDIFIDKSSVEIYIDGKCAMSSRLYLGAECDKLKLIGKGFTVNELSVYSMKNCFELVNDSEEHEKNNK